MNNKYNKYNSFKKAFAVAGCVVICCVSAGLCSCQKNPDESIVKNKDFDKLVDKAKDEKNGVKNVGEVFKENETYKNTFVDENFGVSVNVDAVVSIPEAEKLSVLRVKQKNISQDFLDSVKAKYFGNENIYDAAALEIKTKKTIEQDIKSLKQEAEDVTKKKADGTMSEEEYSSYLEEYEQNISSLKAEYEQAPDRVNLDDYIIDGKIYRAEKVRDNNEFYKWAYDLNQNGEIFCGVSNGSDNVYKTLYVQNNENYGNCLRYRMSKNDYVWAYSTVVGADITGRERYTGEVDFKENKLTLSKDDAIKQTEEFMNSEGLGEYKLYSCEQTQSVEDLRYSDKNILNNIYEITYMRNIDGAFVLPNSEKHSEGWNGDSYSKKIWAVEAVVFQVDDDGIIGVDYSAPIEITDTVVEKAILKKFDEVKETFEKMVTAIYAENTPENAKKEIEVTDIRLGYAIISEEGSFDTGLLVPVWDFNGIIKQYGRTEEKSIMTINAIDGTVINRELGY